MQLSWFKQYFLTLFILLPARLLLTWLKENWWIDIANRSEGSLVLCWLITWLISIFPMMDEKNDNRVFLSSIAAFFFCARQCSEMEEAITLCLIKFFYYCICYKKTLSGHFSVYRFFECWPIYLNWSKDSDLFYILDYIVHTKNTETKTRRTNNT